MAINRGSKCIQPHKCYSVTFLHYTFQLGTASKIVLWKYIWRNFKERLRRYPNICFVSI